jgi:hypothetical protein
MVDSRLVCTVDSRGETAEMLKCVDGYRYSLEQSEVCIDLSWNRVETIALADPLRLIFILGMSPSGQNLPSFHYPHSGNVLDEPPWNHV